MAGDGWMECRRKDKDQDKDRTKYSVRVGVD
jgi:hypothetical protein